MAATTLPALRQGAQAARRSWGRTQTLCAIGVAVIALLPALGLSFAHVQDLAGWFYLALAASGLVIAVGFGGLPSLGQGAFMSVGALTTAVLAGRAGWPAMAALPVAVAVAILLGLLTGLALVRLPRVFVAVSTWLLTWLVAIAADEFPWLSGGSQGYVTSSPLTTTGHYELALALTVVVVGLLAVFRASPAGLRLRAVRDTPAPATVLGVRGDRMLFGAFVVSSAVARVGRAPPPAPPGGSGPPPVRPAPPVS